MVTCSGSRTGSLDTLVARTICGAFGSELGRTSVWNRDALSWFVELAVSTPIEASAAFCESEGTVSNEGGVTGTMPTDRGSTSDVVSTGSPVAGGVFTGNTADTCRTDDSATVVGDTVAAETELDAEETVSVDATSSVVDDDVSDDRAYRAASVCVENGDFAVSANRW